MALIPNTSVSPGEEVAIINSGDVAFYGYGGGGSGLYLYSNGQASFLSALRGYPFDVAVNDSDSVASFVMATNQDGIYFYANGVLTPVASVIESQHRRGQEWVAPFGRTRVPQFQN